MTEDSIDRLFSNLKAVAISADFEDRILLRVEERINSSLKRRLYTKVALMGSAILILMPIFVLALRWMIADLLSSGMIGFLTILVTDFSSVWGSLSDLIWGILESFPIAGTFITLSVTVLLLVIIREIVLMLSGSKPVHMQHR